MEYKKKFLIIGNKNAITYKEIFTLIKENRLWIGYQSMGTDMLFDIPPDAANGFVESNKEGSAYRVVDGVVKARSSAVWFTNLDVKKRFEKLTLYKRYTPEAYPKYDNYDAIEVDKTAEIPKDYDGVMGVPISFLDKYNPQQFEIINALNRYPLFDEDDFIINRDENRIGKHMCSINNGERFTYFRVIIRRYK